MNFCDGSNVKYFGHAGMRVGDVPTDLWDRLLGYIDPTFVCYISEVTISPRPVWLRTSLTNYEGGGLELREICCHVVVGEVLPRAE